MKVLLGERGSGITTDLILESAKFHIPILVLTDSLTKVYTEKAKSLGVEIPKPISLQNIDSNIQYDKIIIDNFDLIFSQLLKEKGLHVKRIETIGKGLERMSI